jgi:hypothetical protein
MRTTRLTNLLLAAFIALFAARELHELGSFCMLSPFSSSSPFSTTVMDTTTSTNTALPPPPPPFSNPVNSAGPVGTVGKSTNSHFYAAVSDAYRLIVAASDGHLNTKNESPSEQAPLALRGARTKFDVSTWNKTTTGGLAPEDREMLGRIYGNANSVFEYGLGESTYIAHHVGVPRYAGIDSDAAWISMVRSNVSDTYRFYFADIGPTKFWGFPTKSLQKAAYNYQVVPLLSEPQAFDVYMVDGRYRTGCLLLSFLHASSSAAPTTATSTTTPTTVLVHDCHRQSYHVADHLLQLVKFDGVNLCAYQRKKTTTDQQLYDLWRAEFRKID